MVCDAQIDTLILILCPALFWLSLFETIFSIIKLDQNRPWLAQLFWLLLSGDWEIAGFYSGWLGSKGEEVVRQESASRLNETWGAFTLRCLKITAITTPLEMFVQNLPYLVVALVIWVARNGPAMRAFVEGLLNRLRGVGLVEKLLKIDKAVALKRDFYCYCLIGVSAEEEFHGEELASENMSPTWAVLWIQISSQCFWYGSNILDRVSIDFRTRPGPSFNERYLAGISRAKAFYQ